MNEQSEALREKNDHAALREAAEAALDELTASLTQVLKAVNKVHRVVTRLGDAIGAPSPPSTKDSPESEG